MSSGEIVVVICDKGTETAGEEENIEYEEVFYSK